MGADAKLGDRMTAAAPATTASVAQELVALCRAGRNLDAVNKLYSPKIVSIEPMGSESMPAEMTGLDAVRGKNQWWFERVSSRCTTPTRLPSSRRVSGSR
jgi:hypothetical protein